MTPAEGALEIEISRFPDLSVLETEWRTLEAAAAGDLSFFQSWTWVGCLAVERFPDPVLLRARTGGRTVGLALFNRRGRQLHLTASGDAVLDAPYIEHNAPLCLPDGSGGQAVAESLIQAAWEVPRTRRLLLPGVAETLARAAGSNILRWHRHRVPLVDLEVVRRAGLPYLQTRSANTRGQIRRSLRRYEARGPLNLTRAETEAEASSWLDALITLHTETWERRGKPGAFAHPFLRRFHKALVQRAQTRGELDLLRLTAGDGVIGYLYNFRRCGRVSAYQSGFTYATETAQEKPGLCLHTLAIERALTVGDAVYDFLAGDDRYKLSLANAQTQLVWVELARPGISGSLEAAGRKIMRSFRGRRR